MLLLARLSLTTQLVPNPLNWSQTHSTGPQIVFLTDISVSVAQMKKSSFIFKFCFWQDFSHPVNCPNPFNWSLKTLLTEYMNSKNVSDLKYV